MDDKIMNTNDEIEIDLSRILGALAHNAWLIVITAILCAVITFVGTMLFVTPQYQSSTMFYVNNNSDSQGETSVSISSGDISASRGLVKSYIVILYTRETLNDVIDYAGVDRSYGEIRNMIAAEAVDDTEIFRVDVTSSDPLEAERIANAIAQILPQRISSIIEGTSAKIVDSAVVPFRPSSPHKIQNAMVAFMLCLVLTAGVVIVLELMDTSIHSEEDISRNCKYPVLATIPDMEGHGKGQKQTCDKSPKKEKVELVCGNINLAAAESYKILRTKLQFSFADDGKCHIIGVSSAMVGEGKSLSAINLAYTTAQLGKRVLLIDCDMRRPSLADKIPIQKHPGLSEYLKGQTTVENLLQPCGVQDDAQVFHAVSAGQTPKNPMELLSSVRMKQMLEQLRSHYDYIILDLPPVGEVGDAMVAAKLTDGMLMVVRQDYCNRDALNSAMRQFEFVDAKILGVVFNCIAGKDRGYCRKYNRRYYGRYYGISGEEHSDEVDVSNP